MRISSPTGRGAPQGQAGATVFFALWATASVALGVMIMGAQRLAQPSVINGAVSVALLLAATAALWVWLRPVPTPAVRAKVVTRRRPFALLLTATIVVLMLSGLLGTVVLIPVAGAAAAVLLRLRGRPTRRQLAIASLLGAVAAAAGVAEAWVHMDAAGVVFGLFQLPLVVLTLLAGWVLARRCGLWDAGLGPVVALTGSAGAALRAFGFGLLLALPWALGNVVNGAPAGDDMRVAWQPIVAAAQPGVAEEAWARAFLIPALFAGVARARPALLAAVLVSSYWFAYPHIPTDPLFIVGVGTIYVIPMALVWLRHGLETAIGFHVAVDLTRYVGAYLSSQGVWFV